MLELRVNGAVFETDPPVGRTLAETLRDQSRLANTRYTGGVSSYLEVLDTERQRLTAEQELAQSQRDVLTSLVQLYRALGGGWQ